MSVTNRRAFVTAFGEPADVLVIREQDPPQAPGAGEVLVRMLFSPINPADFLRMRGQFGFPFGGEFAAGGEGSGRIESVGDGVEGLAAGDLVILPYGDTWADAHVLPADKVIKIPADCDPQQASMLGINAITPALLLRVVDLKEGDWVLLNAANSAVGKLVIQYAAQQGIKTIGIVRREEAVAELKGLGATEVLVGEDDLKARVAAVVSPSGKQVRLALDAIAGESSGRLVDCLGMGGHLCCYGLLSNKNLSLPPQRIAFHGITVGGFSRFGELAKLGVQEATKMYNTLAQQVIDGAVNSVEIEQVYPLSELQAAMAHQEKAGRQGKILLQFN